MVSTEPRKLYSMQLRWKICIENNLIITATILGVAILMMVVGTNQVYAFTVWSVTMNKTIDLPIPIKPLYPSTTFTDKGTCGYDGLIALQNVAKEKVQNPAMFKGDAFIAIELPNGTYPKYLWCGLK